VNSPVAHEGVTAVDRVVTVEIGEAVAGFLGDDLHWRVVRRVPADAAHPYAVLAGAGITTAARVGLPWAARELSAWPGSVQALTDAATLDGAVGRALASRREMRRARRLDPSDPYL